MGVVDALSGHVDRGGALSDDLPALLAGGLELDGAGVPLDGGASSTAGTSSVFSGSGACGTPSSFSATAAIKETFAAEHQRAMGHPEHVFARELWRPKQGVASMARPRK